MRINSLAPSFRGDYCIQAKDASTADKIIRGIDQEIKEAGIKGTTETSELNRPPNYVYVHTEARQFNYTDRQILFTGLERAFAGRRDQSSLIEYDRIYVNLRLAFRNYTEAHGLIADRGHKVEDVNPKEP